LFEVEDTDLAGRIGRLTVGDKELETPAFLPVVHPFRQEVSAAELKGMGFGAVMTNSYITKRKWGEEAVRRGIHDIIGFDGIVMTDSGGYQALIYGEVKVDPVSIAKYQRDIGSDIAVVLDLPTGYPASRERALFTVRETLKAERKTLKAVTERPPLLVGPIQGGAHEDIMARCARAVAKMPFDVYAIGSPVEIMNGYDFDVLASIIRVAKANLPPDKPVHLFGAAHPLTIPMAVAMGCDLFDSASYVLFAKQDRYMTPTGVRRLSELAYLPCVCPVCARSSPEELAALVPRERTRALALHNLYLLKSEVEGAKQALKEGRLWEHVAQKARSHPKLFTGTMRMAEGTDQLMEGTPVSKQKAIMLFDRLDYIRPELVRYRDAVSKRWMPTSRRLVLLVVSHVDERFFAEVPEMLACASAGGFDLCLFREFFGVVPLELYGTYPVSQSLACEVTDAQVLERSVKDAIAILSKKGFREATVISEEGMLPLSSELAAALRAEVRPIRRGHVAALKEFASSLRVH